MNGLLILAVVGFAAVVLLVASGQVATGVESIMCQFISGPRADPWPRGVQERDIDRPWGEYHRAEGDPDAEYVPPVATQAVHARLGRPGRI